MKGQNISVFIAICVVIGFNVALTVWTTKASAVKGLLHTSGETQNFSYVGSDYPVEYPISKLDTVGMILQETIHYSVDTTADWQIQDEEWMALLKQPEGVGYTHLGEEHRLFLVTFHHQLHCVHQLQLALAGVIARDQVHIRHCFNYLRQTLLCTSADMLEEGDFMMKDYTYDRIGDALVCKDWERLYNALDEDDREWMKWRADWD